MLHRLMQTHHTRDLYHCFLFFFNDTATTEIYTLSLHDALPISLRRRSLWMFSPPRLIGVEEPMFVCGAIARMSAAWPIRSEEHTSELQSHVNLVCRLLLEKKKKNLNVSTLASTTLYSSSGC